MKKLFYLSLILSLLLFDYSIMSINSSLHIISYYIIYERNQLLQKQEDLNTKLIQAKNDLNLQFKFEDNRCVCTLWESSEYEPKLSRQQICSDHSDLSTKR